MTANVSDLNSSANTKTSDFDGFLNEPPYCYGWTTNSAGVKVPIIPFVISILEPQSLDKNEENALKRYLTAFIEQWKWPKDVPLLIVANMSGTIGGIINRVIADLKKRTKEESNGVDSYSFVRPVDQSELIPQTRENSNDKELPCQFINRHLTIVIYRGENNSDPEQQAPIYDSLRNYLSSRFQDSYENYINSVLHIKSNSSSGDQNVSVYYYRNLKTPSCKSTINSPSKLIKRLGIISVLDNIGTINRISYAKDKEPQIDDPIINSSSIDAHDNSVKQLIGYSMFYQDLSRDFKKKMKKHINAFCIVSLLLFICNALIIYINSMCISSLGVNALQLTRYCTLETKESRLFDTITLLTSIETKIKTAIEVDNGTASETATGTIVKTRIPKNVKGLKESHIDLNFVKISNGDFICTVFLILAAVTVLLLLYISIKCCIIDYFHSRCHDKYHNLQTLSDCLKIQAYWRYSGITELIVNNNLLSKQAPPWLLTALNGIYSTVPFVTSSRKAYKERVTLLNDAWIRKDIDYFKNELKKSQWGELGWFSFVVGLLWAVLTAFFLMFFIVSFFSTIDYILRVGNALILACVLAIIVGAIVIINHYLPRSGSSLKIFCNNLLF